MNIFIFGLGYSAMHFVRQHRNSFVRIGGCVRNIDKRDALRAEGFDVFTLEEDGLADFLAQCDDIIVSIGPDEAGDPVLNRFTSSLRDMPLLQRVIYLSTVGVYGDHQGEWVDETTPPRPDSQRSIQRLRAEKAWQVFAQEQGCDLHILRLAGIYGPGRSAVDNLRAGKAKRIVKPGQVFNRIHVADIGRTIAACLASEHGGGYKVWNVADNEPAPPQDVVAYAAHLLDMEPPPEIAFEDAQMTPMARSFYGENKRVSNRALREDLRVDLEFPTYREGLASIMQAQAETV